MPAVSKVPLAWTCPRKFVVTLTPQWSSVLKRERLQDYSRCHVLQSERLSVQYLGPKSALLPFGGWGLQLRTLFDERDFTRCGHSVLFSEEELFDKLRSNPDTFGRQIQTAPTTSNLSLFLYAAIFTHHRSTA